ncbi:hypothetical protein R5R35_007952 [Gryllus longicercus]|uniref:Zinc transporter 1 n=1 Tax=Gryllus longicercus TaxID=2509291 RepID=A0AAN9VG00_9ORTH
MAVKKWLGRLRPAPLYLMLAVTGLFFVTQLVMSHMTHALTLLVDAYHMLCNLIALAGCIITIKYGSASAEGEEEPGGSAEPPALTCHKHESTGCSAHHNKHFQNEHHKHQLHHHHHSGSSSERRLKNTFGWARIDVLVMLIGCVFLTSLCFSLIVEALQTLIHIEHHDAMHHPIPVLVLGCVGLLINGLCYLFIGGYTFHQASFLHVTPDGEVVLDHVMNQDSVRKGQRRLSAQTRRPPPPPQYTLRQGPREMCRDIVGCIYVIVCALIVYLIDKEYAKYIDPILSIVSAITLLVLSYPYMRESGSILLQTIPDTININSLRKDLLKAFPDILNVHDLHVWRLTASKVFSTAHIIFLNNKDYSRITKEITDFFHNQGITQVTIQPEFFQAENANGIVALPNIHDDQCLVPCLGDGCYILHCCANNGYKLTSVTVSSTDQPKHNKNDKMGDMKRTKDQPTMKIQKPNHLQPIQDSQKISKSNYDSENNENESQRMNNATAEINTTNLSNTLDISAENPSSHHYSRSCENTNATCTYNSISPGEEVQQSESPSLSPTESNKTEESGETGTSEIKEAQVLNSAEVQTGKDQNSSQNHCTGNSYSAEKQTETKETTKNISLPDSSEDSETEIKDKSVKEELK